MVAVMIARPPVLDGHHLHNVEQCVSRLRPHAADLDLPQHDLDLYLWVTAAYYAAWAHD